MIYIYILSVRAHVAWNNKLRVICYNNVYDQDIQVWRESCMTNGRTGKKMASFINMVGVKV